jgi:hypothetical protein
MVRLPHLLTVCDGSGSLADAVVWEVMTRAQACAWLGSPLPCQSFFEQHLAALLHLRVMVRTGHLPASGDGQHLRKLITERYLSIRLVYRHPELFAALIRAIGVRPVPGGEDA